MIPSRGYLFMLSIIFSLKLHGLNCPLEGFRNENTEHSSNKGLPAKDLRQLACRNEN